MLRRLFRLDEPLTPIDAWNNLVTLGWWTFGFMLAAALVGVGAKTVFGSGFPLGLVVLVAALLVAALVAVTALVAEFAAVVRLRARERRTRPPTGNPLVDHDLAVGIIVCLIIIVGVSAYFILHPP
jgi:hypothetical protein